MPPSVKAGLLAKLREYKSDLNNLKSELKRISTANPNQAAREELLESGMADTLAVCYGLSFILVLDLVISVNCHASLFFDFSWRTM